MIDDETRRARTEEGGMGPLDEQYEGQGDGIDDPVIGGDEDATRIDRPDIGGPPVEGDDEGSSTGVPEEVVDEREGLGP